MAEETRKIYVLDTNVLIHDPFALNQFDEHDVVLPIVVLEEMDRVKRGMDEASRNVREVSRQLDVLSESCDVLEEGCALPGGGRLYFELNGMGLEVLPESLARSSGDNRILGITMALQKQHEDREVVLVSKDINLRIKARAVGVFSEDYRSDRVVEDVDVLSGGQYHLDEESWAAMGEGMEVREEEGRQVYRVTWPEDEPMPHRNNFVRLPGEKETVLQCVGIGEGRRLTLRETHSHRSDRHAVWGIKARNAEQNMAMNLLLDSGIDIVSLLGHAGTGKTLLALACGLHQTLELDLYDRIVVTRATVPVGQDIGFLPGTEKEKLEPWMGAISDNLKLLLGGEFRTLGEMAGQHRLEITALSFTRGRTFTRTWLIVDEAQNLTPHQMKSLITRMGEGSKILILGNNAQIDTPYLTARTNGLSMAAIAFMDWEHAGNLTLVESERSRLAARAIEVMP